MRGTIAFAYLGGLAFVAIGVWLSWRSHRLHPLLLICLSALSFSWIEAPYDWAVYAQFPPAIPRMPSWWPLDVTWHGLPASVPPGYISYFVMPTVIGAFVGRRLCARYGWRRPQALLGTGLVVGFVWAFLFNGIIGARLGVFSYGRVITGLALWAGTKHQYPLYDALAMGVQVMVFTYLLGRTDDQGRTVIDIWADSKTHHRLSSALVSVLGFVLVGHLVYLSVFAPHLLTKVTGQVDTAPPGQLFTGVPNQPK
jgi:hypothetical protein